MSTPYGWLRFVSAVSSVNELRATFPAGGDEHLMMVPFGAEPGVNWPFPTTGIWSPPGSWDDLRFLFDAMSGRSAWQEFETTRKTDDLRDTCLVHHFHLEPYRKKRQRSSYRWFAFRDPLRFGNVWFSLGGTYRSRGTLRPLWTSPEWMARIAQLYPWVALKYRIRGNPGLPTSVALPAAVRHIWKDEPDCFPVVKVGDFFHLCAGGRARDLDLERHAEHDRWGVYVTPQGSFSKFLEADPEGLLRQFQEASETADRVMAKANSGGLVSGR